ncbi:MAG: hypothetical protein U0935_11685 [Pirellulales bacterium]
MGKRLRRWTLRCLVGLIGLLLAGPWLLSVTALLNPLINLATGPRGTVVQLRSASLGWFHSLELRGIQVEQEARGNSFTVERVALDRSLLGLLWHRPDLGAILVDKPTARLRVPDEPPPDEPPADATGGSSAAPPRFQLTVRDAQVVLWHPRHAEPVFDIGPVSLNIATHDDPHGPVLVAEPCTLIHRRVLTADDCRRGLDLVAPILGQAAQVDGEFSLELSRMRIPYGPDAPQRFQAEADVAGELRLHQVSAGSGSGTLARIAALAGKFLGRDVPAKVKLADDTRIQFQLSQGRFHHEGLRFGLPDLGPDVQLESRGSVGLDRSLDLEVSIPIPARLVLDRPLFRQLSEQPLRLHVTGSLDEPQLALAEDQNWLGQIVRQFAASRAKPGAAPSPDAAPGETDPTTPERPSSADPPADLSSSLADPLLETLSDLLQRRRQKRESATGSRSDPDVAPAPAESPPPESRESLLKKWRDQRRKAVRPDTPRKGDF